MLDTKVGVFGASSLVGTCFLAQMEEVGQSVIAFSREKREMIQSEIVEWRQLPTKGTIEADTVRSITNWISMAPIWILPNYFPLIEASGARRVVALASTSRFSKVDSSDATENAIAEKLTHAEMQLQTWAQSRGIEWVVLRPTLIYGMGRDKNISEIARFIRRFNFFPLLGRAQGLRQPIHVKDVAAACFAALQAPGAANCAYNLSGGETLTYREMVSRIFTALDQTVRLVTVPLWIFRGAVNILHILPSYRHLSAAMAERMNQDLVFDHTDATRDFGFRPRSFALTAEDLPR